MWFVKLVAVSALFFGAWLAWGSSYDQSTIAWRLCHNYSVQLSDIAGEARYVVAPFIAGMLALGVMKMGEVKVR